MEVRSHLETGDGSSRQGAALPWLEESRYTIFRLDGKLKQGALDELSLAGRISRNHDPDPAWRWRGGGRAAEKIEGRRQRVDGDYRRLGIRRDGGSFRCDRLRKQRCASES